MGDIEERWLVRRKIGPYAIKTIMYHSEEAALQAAYEHHGERWVIVEYYFERYGVASRTEIIYEWANRLYYHDGIVPKTEL